MATCMLLPFPSPRKAGRGCRARYSARGRRGAITRPSPGSPPSAVRHPLPQAGEGKRACAPHSLCTTPRVNLTAITARRTLFRGMRLGGGGGHGKTEKRRGPTPFFLFGGGGPGGGP